MKTVTKGKKKSGSSVPIVDSLATALSLLNYFNIKNPELSLLQLSEKSGLYKSRVHRLCATLVLSGFLIRMPWSSYRLGPKLMALGKIYETTNSIISISRPIMKELANISGESVALFAFDGETSFCLARELGSSSLVFSINEGDTMQLHASAVGRILMAYGPKELHDNVLGRDKLETFTPLTIVDPKKIKAELKSIKKLGYAINRGERELEVAAVAVPIFNHDNNVNEVLAVVGPAQRFTDEHIAEILIALKDSTGKISKLIGGSN